MSDESPRSKKRWTGSVLAGFAMALWACFNFEQPVEERLRLMFLADGGLRLQIAVELHYPDSDDPSSALEQRLQQLADDLLDGRDAWPARFQEVAATIESFYWEKEEGRLVYAERNAVLDDPADLAAVLADTPIQSTFRVEDGVAELVLFPGLPDRATRRERREIAEVLDKWSEVLPAYFQAGEELYRYLETQPNRALPIFGELFDSDEDYGEVSPEEDALLETLGDASTELTEVLEVDAKRAYSLDELSRRVYDPFPARFEVELPSQAIEDEGFAGADQRWAVDGLSLWTAFERLEGRWLAPDPVLAWIAHERTAPDTPFDVEGFAARPRSARAADPREVLEALEEGLTPAEVYRLTWRVSPTDETR